MNPTNFPARPILLVDDEEQFLITASRALRAEGINHVVTCQDSREVMSMLSETEFSVVLLDLLMPELSGMDLLPLILAGFPELPVTIVTGVKHVETAVECLKTGAYDYLLKPVDSTRLAGTVRRGVEINDLRRQNRQLKNRLLSDELEQPEAFADIITQDRAMHAIFKYIESIAGTDLPVLITGETGVGKELIAASIHKRSGREGKFASVNIAGLDDQLFSDTLFGHRKGAYTDADKFRQGLIDQASNGTLFLDEIGDLHVESQVKLLRLLQDKTYYPLGDDFARLSSARLVFATNREIEFLSNPGTFRTDLYHRLQPHHIHLPPLRERLDDIPMLVVHFLESAAVQLGKQTPTAPPELITLLGTYHFPGNIRELEGLVLDAVSQHTGGILSTSTFRQKINEQSAIPHEETTLKAGADTFSDELSARSVLPDLKEALKEAEQQIISEALKRADGNQTIAAQLLGISRQALNKRLSRTRTSSDDE